MPLGLGAVTNGIFFKRIYTPIHDHDTDDNSCPSSCASHDGAVLWRVVLVGLGDVVVASTAIRPIRSVLSAASEGTMRVTPRAVRVTHASPGSILACVLAAVRAPVMQGFQEKKGSGGEMYEATRAW